MSPTYVEKVCKPRQTLNQLNKKITIEPLTLHAPVLERALYVAGGLLCQVLNEVPLVLELVVAAVPQALEQQVLVAVGRGALRGPGRGLRHALPPASQQQVGGGLLVLLLCPLLVVGLAQDGQVAPLHDWGES